MQSTIRVTFMHESRQGDESRQENEAGCFTMFAGFDRLPAENSGKRCNLDCHGRGGSRFVLVERVILQLMGAADFG